jgi:Small-conductance mechanosensitive channel
MLTSCSLIATRRIASIGLNKSWGKVLRTPFASSHPRQGAWILFFQVMLCLLLTTSLGYAQEASREPAAPAESVTSSAASPSTVSYSALADTLSDPEARDRLIEQLRTLAEAEETKRQADADIKPSGIAVWSQRLGSTLQGITAQLGNDIQATLDAFRRVGTGEGVTEGKLDAWLPALKVLALVIVATLAAYALLRMVASVLFGRLDQWIRSKPKSVDEQVAVNGGAALKEDGPIPASERMGFHHSVPKALPRLRRLTLSRKLLAVLLALLVDVGASLLAALGGYVVAATLADHSQGSGTLAFQFLTAFVLIEAVKSLSRAVFATRYEQLRLLPLQPESAQYWNRWISLLIALTGYCLLVVVPVGQAVLAPSIGRLIGLIIMLCVYVTGLRVVWRQKAEVRAGLMNRAERTNTAVFGTLLRALARCWHWLAFAYFTVLLFASQAEQAAALAFIMSATVQSIVAIGVGALLTAGLNKLEMHRVALPETWNQNFPLLERRFNSYKDPALRGVHLALVILVVLVVLDAWRAFDLAAWLSSEGGRATLAMIVRVGIVLFAAALAWTILASLIEHRLGATAGRRASEREKTLLMLFRNAAAIVIATMTVLVLLSQIGIDIGPLIAGAGVVGLAIGFGAQKLVQDVITGVFIQLENGMNQNDIVEVAGRFGTVEKITVRSVVIRTLDGGYHLIPFSSIDTVSNHTRDFGYHYAEYNIAHREDVDQAMAELEAAFHDLKKDAALAAEVLADIEIPGVTALNERGFSVRVLIKTTPGNQWMIQRAYNRLVKQRFDAAGIELPYPQTVVHFGRDRDGRAEPVDIRTIEVMRQSVRGAAS